MTEQGLTQQHPYTAGGVHFGMSGMEMRAKLLGGTLTITSQPETGTEVRLEVPLEKES